MNQGLYIGFLAAGLLWSFFAGEPAKIFFLSCVIIAGVFNPEDAKKFGPTLPDVDQLVADIAATGKVASTFPDADAIVEHLGPQLQDGDVVAIMSNGGFGAIHEKILDVLRS